MSLQPTTPKVLEWPYDAPDFSALSRGYIVHSGQPRPGKPRYRCREQPCAGRTFLLDYSYPGQSPTVKQQLVEMAMNTSSIRDTARVLHVSTTTVMTE